MTIRVKIEPANEDGNAVDVYRAEGGSFRKLGTLTGGNSEEFYVWHGSHLVVKEKDDK